LRHATALFYDEGIHATGIARLIDTAQVSTRTLYQHFPSKSALVEAYLGHLAESAAAQLDEHVGRADTPRERLLSVFTMAAEYSVTPSQAAVARGCPFHNAAVEVGGEMPAAAELVRQYKLWLTARLTEIAGQANAHDPLRLGRHLAVLLEGAAALAASLNSIEPYRDATEAARLLIEHAIPKD
jgi:AcrR family transcriptional regulator